MLYGKQIFATPPVWRWTSHAWLFQNWLFDSRKTHRKEYKVVKGVSTWFKLFLIVYSGVIHLYIHLHIVNYLLDVWVYKAMHVTRKTYLINSIKHFVLYSSCDVFLLSIIVRWNYLRQAIFWLHLPAGQVNKIQRIK